jgi:hypothetical protein
MEVEQTVEKNIKRLRNVLGGLVAFKEAGKQHNSSVPWQNHSAGASSAGASIAAEKRATEQERRQKKQAVRIDTVGISDRNLQTSIKSLGKLDSETLKVLKSMIGQPDDLSTEKKAAHVSCFHSIEIKTDPTADVLRILGMPEGSNSEKFVNLFRKSIEFSEERADTQKILAIMLTTLQDLARPGLGMPNAKLKVLEIGGKKCLQIEFFMVYTALKREFVSPEKPNSDPCIVYRMQVLFVPKSKQMEIISFGTPVGIWQYKSSQHMHFEEGSELLVKFGPGIADSNNAFIEKAERVIAQVSKESRAKMQGKFKENNGCGSDRLILSDMLREGSTAHSIDFANKCIGFFETSHPNCMTLLTYPRMCLEMLEDCDKCDNNAELLRTLFNTVCITSPESIGETSEDGTCIFSTVLNVVAHAGASHGCVFLEGGIALYDMLVVSWGNAFFLPPTKKERIKVPPLKSILELTLKDEELDRETAKPMEIFILAILATIFMKNGQFSGNTYPEIKQAEEVPDQEQVENQVKARRYYIHQNIFQEWEVALEILKNNHLRVTIRSSETNDGTVHERFNVLKYFKHANGDPNLFPLEGLGNAFAQFPRADVKLLEKPAHVGVGDNDTSVNGYFGKLRSMDSAGKGCHFDKCLQALRKPEDCRNVEVPAFQFICTTEHNPPNAWECIHGPKWMNSFVMNILQCLFISSVGASCARLGMGWNEDNKEVVCIGEIDFQKLARDPSAFLSNHFVQLRIILAKVQKPLILFCSNDNNHTHWDSGCMHISSYTLLTADSMSNSAETIRKVQPIMRLMFVWHFFMHQSRMPTAGEIPELSLFAVQNGFQSDNWSCAYYSYFAWAMLIERARALGNASFLQQVEPVGDGKGEKLQFMVLCLIATWGLQERSDNNLPPRLKVEEQEEAGQKEIYENAADPEKEEQPEPGNAAHPEKRKSTKRSKLRQHEVLDKEFMEAVCQVQAYNLSTQEECAKKFDIPEDFAKDVWKTKVAKGKEKQVKHNHYLPKCCDIILDTCRGSLTTEGEVVRYFHNERADEQNPLVVFTWSLLSEGDTVFDKYFKAFLYPHNNCTRLVQKSCTDLYDKNGKNVKGMSTVYVRDNKDGTSNVCDFFLCTWKGGFGLITENRKLNTKAADETYPKAQAHRLEETSSDDDEFGSSQKNTRKRKPEVAPIKPLRKKMKSK